MNSKKAKLVTKLLNKVSKHSTVPEMYLRVSLMLARDFIIIHGLENVNPKLGRCVAGQ